MNKLPKQSKSSLAKRNNQEKKKKRRKKKKEKRRHSPCPRLRTKQQSTPYTTHNHHKRPLHQLDTENQQHRRPSVDPSQELKAHTGPCRQPHPRTGTSFLLVSDITSTNLLPAQTCLVLFCHVVPILSMYSVCVRCASVLTLCTCAAVHQHHVHCCFVFSANSFD